MESERPFPDWLTSTLASDASEGRGVLPHHILPLQPDWHVVGPARTLWLSRDDNAAVRQALQAPHPGTVLVAAGGSRSRTATIGGLLAREMRQAGILGLVTDGLVRDSQEIRQLGFPVWCRGVTPTASRKDGPVSVGSQVQISGITIHEGDLVIADADGVVVWPMDQLDVLLARAEARLKLDQDRLARLQNSR